MRKVSFAQALVTLGCFAAIGLAHYAGPVEGTLVSAAVAYLLWMKEPPAGPTPPAVKAALALLIGLTFGHLTVACTPLVFTPADATHVLDTSAAHAHCQQVGREGPDGGHIAAFDACEKDAGL